jgi:hypothetical protein
MGVKYGIKIPFDDTKVWVMEDSGLPFPNNQRVQLFDTKAEAEDAAKIWKNYSIEEHYTNEDFDWDNLANNQKA